MSLYFSNPRIIATKIKCDTCENDKYIFHTSFSKIESKLLESKETMSIIESIKYLDVNDSCILCISSPGGGVVELTVKKTLTVDGYIRANSEDVKASLASGGSGGSVLIRTQNFTGKYHRNR